MGPGQPDPLEEDRLRARLYAFLSGLLSGPPGDEALAALRSLPSDATPMGQALGDLAAAAAGFDAAAAEIEYNRLFVGLTEGELIPYGSYYLTGFLFEKPLSALRADLRALGLERSERFAEPEDHIAALFETMHALILGSFGPPADLPTQRRFFETHIACWAPRFFKDLESAEAAVLYRPVARVGSLFLAIEAEAFAMA